MGHWNVVYCREVSGLKCPLHRSFVMSIWLSFHSFPRKVSVAEWCTLGNFNSFCFREEVRKRSDHYLQPGWFHSIRCLTRCARYTTVQCTFLMAIFIACLENVHLIWFQTLKWRHFQNVFLKEQTLQLFCQSLKS